MSDIKCVYLNCDNTGKDITMFPFPVHDPKRVLVWISNSGNVLLDSFNNQELLQQHICRDHFQLRYLDSNGRLTNTAIPIHFMSDPENIYFPNQEIGNVIMEDDSNNSESVIKNSDNSYGECRCCLKKGSHRNIMKEYTHEGKREVYNEMFLNCMNLFLLADSQITQLICSDCVRRLRDAVTFRQLVTDTELKLVKLMNNQVIFVKDPDPKSIINMENEDPIYSGDMCDDDFEVKTEETENMSQYEKEMRDEDIDVDFSSVNMMNDPKILAKSTSHNQNENNLKELNMSPMKRNYENDETVSVTVRVVTNSEDKKLSNFKITQNKLNIMRAKKAPVKNVYDNAENGVKITKLKPDTHAISYMSNIVKAINKDNNINIKKRMIERLLSEYEKNKARINMGSYLNSLSNRPKDNMIKNSKPIGTSQTTDKT